MANAERYVYLVAVKVFVPTVDRNQDVKSVEALDSAFMGGWSPYAKTAEDREYANTAEYESNA